MLSAEYRAMKALQLLDDEVLVAAFATMEERALREATAVPFWAGRIGDRKRRRALERRKLIQELRGELEAVIRDGKQSARPRAGVA